MLPIGEHWVFWGQQQVAVICGQCLQRFCPFGVFCQSAQELYGAQIVHQTSSMSSAFLFVALWERLGKANLLVSVR